MSEDWVKQAVALYYDGQGAPEVTAKGTGETAEEILALAREHGIPLCDHPGLLELLMTLDIGESIPRELYLAVAHILAFAYHLQGKTPPQEPPDGRLKED